MLEEAKSIKTSERTRMARSYKNTPISGYTTCESDKKDKQKASRTTRRRERVALKNVSLADAGEGHLGTHRFEDNPSYFSKDGKQFHHGRSIKYARGSRIHRTFWKELRK